MCHGPAGARPVGEGITIAGRPADEILATIRDVELHKGVLKALTEDELDLIARVVEALSTSEPHPGT